MKKQKQRLKKYLLVTIIFCAFFVMASAIKAGVNDSLYGWSWGGSENCDMDRNGFNDVLCGGNNTSGVPSGDSSGNVINDNETGIGWISMNGSNCDTDNNGSSNGIGQCPPAGTPIADYGVNLPLVDGDLAGYAWSENLGWIAFDNSNGYLTGCPSGTCTARRNGDKLEGWARFTSIRDALVAGNSGGWEGWIKLNGTNYGVEISKMDGTGTNKTYAWSDEVGFIDFSRASLPPAPTVTMTADGSDYFKIDLGVSTIPKNVSIAWSSTDATTCSVVSGNGTWTDPLNIGTSSVTDKIINVPSGGMNEQFTITCQGPGGEGSDMVTIATVCYPKTCVLQSCDNDLLDIRTGVSNNNVCVSASSCTSTPDCEIRAVDGWKEVAP